MSLMRLAGIAGEDPIVDVGGGASRLVDHLISEGFSNLTVTDISAAALEVSKARLGVASSQVSWLAEDVTSWRPDKPYRLWHDRAVFHFLTEAADRERYKATLASVLMPGGVLIVATFAKDGPSRCSDLEVRQYEPAELGAEFGPAFQAIYAAKHDHTTPAGNIQRFSWCMLRRLGETHD